MKRGDLVMVVLQGDYSKPHPALVTQPDLLDGHPSITILPVTGERRDTPLFSFTVRPDDKNCFPKLSKVMVDKPQAVSREKKEETFSRFNDGAMFTVNRAFAVFLKFA